MSRTDNFGVGASPVPHIAAAARRYQQQNGLHVPARENYNRTVLPAPASREIGEAYLKLPEHDNKALPAFHAMREETKRQFDYMTRPKHKGGLGIDVSVHDHDPYGVPDVHTVYRELHHDVTQNGHIGVLSTKSTGGHAVFSNDENDMFRATHDVFGHLGTGRGIDRDGEEAAYRKHSAMYSPLARGAVATETRGQNGALHLTGSFQDQKVALLPHHLQSLQFGTNASKTDRAEAVQRAREQNHKQGIG